MKDKYWYIINQLNTISRVALLENAYDSQKYIGELIRIIRYRQCDNFENIAVEKELDIIKKMICFYKVQKGKGFSSVIKNEIKGRKVYLPKGSLIFFVENSLEHAFSGDKAQWELKIIIQDNKDRCDIYIQDNGIGFDTELMKKEPERFSEYTEMIKRLESVGQVSVESSENIGTKVHLRLSLNI